VRCPRCGNENPGTNRFCGMCGATLMPASAISTVQHAAGEAPTAVSPLPPRSAAAPPAASPRIAEPRPASTAPEREPVISGPSFLGLNQPAPSTPAKRGSLSIDPKTAPSSRNLDYLLEDDEPETGGGSGKYILIVFALLLAIGMGYLRWKNQGLGWLGKTASKPSAATDSVDSSDSNSSTPPSSSSANSASPSSTPSAAPTGTSPNPVPAPSQPASSQSGSNQSRSNQSESTDSSASSPSANAANSPASSPAPATPNSEGTSSADSAPSDDAKAVNANSTDAAPAPMAKPKPYVPKPAARPADPVTEAQKYLYGKGVKQDCDRGMRLLKPVADQANPKAMIEMGALYSAGLCTPRDLPTSYRWFAVALRKDPNNQALQGDLQKLWDEMTQPERQQAIRLSQ
jgi:hypothetical protein